MSVEVVRLFSGDRNAVGRLEAFGGSVAVGINIFVIVIVNEVGMGKAGDRSFTGER